MLLKDGKVAKVELLHAEAGGVSRGADIVSNAKLPSLWPAGSQATLVRYAFLACESASCELFLQP